MTLNDLGPKFEKGGKDVKRMKESAVLREKRNDGKAVKQPQQAVRLNAKIKICQLLGIVIIAKFSLK